MLRKTSLRLGRSNGLWLMLLLLLVVLAPSICLLWFMNQAVRNERLAVRQKLVDAYRSHLSIAQERIDRYWQQTAAELDAQAESMPASALFASQIRAGGADAVLCFDSTGKLAYPNAGVSQKRALLPPAWTEALRLESSDPGAAALAFAGLTADEANADLAARALQGQARCLIQAGKKDAAIAVLLESLGEEQYRRAMDVEGRLIAPNAELLAVELLKDSEPGQVSAPLERLKQQLLDYDNSPLPASQRRFLMRELQQLFPQEVAFPTLAAEDLAARHVESGQGRPTEPFLRLTSFPGVWQFGSNRGRVVTLHQTESLLARMRAAISSPNLPADVMLTFLPPGKEPEKSLSSLPAATALPGWRLALSLKDERLFDTAAAKRITFYVWIGELVVAAVAILAILALGLVRRQFALTQLRNDLVANVTHELKTPLASMRLLVDTLLNSKDLHQPTAREYLQLIAAGNLRLSRLIDNFLTFSRIERNKTAFEFTGVPAAIIVHGAAAVVRERFNIPGCRFEVQAASNLPSLVADADAM